jgi:NADH-quinone oxidoreductase subunit J
MLVLTLFAIATLFVEQGAEFLAAVQVIVYAGAVVVLFLFVIMLLGVDRRESFVDDRLRWIRPIALGALVLVLIEVSLLTRTHWVTGAHGVTARLSGPGGNVAELARAVFTTYLVPFEATSALLVIAVIGAVVLARARRGPDMVNSTEERQTGDPDAEVRA